jgi:hypothetical protein
MLDSNHRKKMITLRLSEAELELIKAHCHACGARNVSELARLALQRIMTGSPGPPNDFAKKLAELDDRVHALESYLVTPDVAKVGANIPPASLDSLHA